MGLQSSGKSDDKCSSFDTVPQRNGQMDRQLISITADEINKNNSTL